MRELSLFSFFNPITSTSWEGNPDAILLKLIVLICDMSISQEN